MAITTKTAQQDVVVTESISCDNCKGNVPLVFPDPCPDAIQGQDLLIVGFHGGYGMYVDGDSNVHLCKNCADRLRKVFPLFEKVLRRTFTGDPDWRNEEAWKRNETSLVDEVREIKYEADMEEFNK